MAQIRQIVPSPSISEFRPVRQEGGNGFRLLAGAMDAAYQYLEPLAIDQMAKAGDALGRDLAKQQIGAPAPAVTASSKGDPGGSWLRYSNQGATRNDPLDPSLVNAMSFVGDMGITMDVISGGQESNKPGEGTGSTRHNHGMSADVDFYKDGRKLDWNNPQDLPTLQQIVSTAKSRGVTGIGAGDDYMGPGRFHVGFGAPAIWGAGGSSANAPDWLREAYYGAPGGAVTMSAQNAPVTAPTVLRDADGKLTSRLFGPTANPIMAAHDAAAGAAWQADVYLKSAQDMMALSEQFMLNPEGFKQAADEYVAAMVEASPEDFKMDVRANLEKEASRRFLGMIDEKHRDIRQRAANSTSALADKWSEDLAAAIATGNPEEIEAARSELQSVLAVRERLPGLSWTPEQSANYMARAEAEGQSRIKQAADDQKAGWKATLTGIVDAAKLGLTSADETILDNPMVQEMLPQEWQRAAAFATLRDQLPTFNAMPPAQQAAALAEMAKEPVTSPVETEIYGAAKEAYAANAKAWMEDPIKRAGEVLTDDLPPTLPEFDINNPDAFMAALTARAAYGQKLVENGYTKTPFYVSEAEAKSIGAVFAKGVPPEIKAVAAGAIVGAMGDDAAGFFQQISTTDPIIPHVGALMARGGSAAVATEAMTGQALLDEKVVQAPTATAVRSGMETVKSALENTPGAMGSITALSDTARAIYAARIPAGADEDTQAQVMEEAWQAALGQSNRLGRTMGGVQDVGGNPVLLPPTMNGEDLTQALNAAFGLNESAAGFWGRLSSVGRTNNVALPPRSDMWMAAANGMLPAIGGQPIDPRTWREGEMTLTPVGGTKYRLTVRRVIGGEEIVQDVGVQGQPDDVPFIFDAELLLEASLVP